MWLLRLRYSLRSLARDPVFALVVVLVLSLGIAANTTIFTVIDQLVLNPLPFKSPSHLVMVWESNPTIGEPAGSRVPAAWANFEEWRNQTHSFDAMEAFDHAGYNLTGVARPEHLMGARVTGGYFQMLGISAAQGRVISLEDMRPGASAVVVVTDEFWKTHFAGKVALGQKLLLNGAPHTIIGVLPKSFHLPLLFQGVYDYRPDVWVPVPPISAADASKLRHFFVSARLKANTSLAQARAEMVTVAKRLAQSDPNLNTGYSVNLVPFEVENAAPDLNRALCLLWSSAMVVLLLGCINLASLMLVRSMKKQKELAIMRALGAPKSALIASILMESMVLGLVSALLAVAGSYAGVRILRALQPGNIAGSDRLTLDWRGMIFAGAAFVSCVLLFGLLPGWIGARRAPSSALKRSGGAQNTGAGAVLRRVLVSGEVAMALVLAVGATLLARSFQQILAVDPGFRAKNVITARLALAPPRYTTLEDRNRFCEKVLDRVHQIPGVQSASLVDNFPLCAIHYVPFEIEGRPPVQPSNQPTSDFANVTSDFFETMGTPLRSGRTFTPEDMQDNANKVAIVNESMARRFWPDENPVGKHIRVVAPHSAPDPWRLVVGVVGDFHQFNIDTPPRPEMFWPARQFPEMTVVLRTAAEPTSAVPALEKAVADIDKDEPLADIQTLQHMVERSISERKFDMLLLSGFAGLSVVLALVGVYGLVSYIISSRTREIGIRLTLGAQKKHIFLSLILQILPFAAIGVVLGLLLSFFAKQLISGLLFRIDAFDPATYFSLPIVLVLLVFLTCLLPVWRAAGMELLNVLRHE